MNEALSKITEINPITGAPETTIDEDEIIDILISLKTKQVDQLGVASSKPMEEEKHVSSAEANQVDDHSSSQND